MTTLHRQDITAKVAERLGASRSQAETALNAVLESIEDSLTSGERVSVPGFGVWEVVERKERRVRPIRGAQAGQLVTVPASVRVRFKAGTELKRAVATGNVERLANRARQAVRGVFGR